MTNLDVICFDCYFVCSKTCVQLEYFNCKQAENSAKCYNSDFEGVYIVQFVLKVMFIMGICHVQKGKALQQDLIKLSGFFMV